MMNAPNAQEPMWYRSVRQTAPVIARVGVSSLSSTQYHELIAPEMDIIVMAISLKRPAIYHESG